MREITRHFRDSITGEHIPEQKRLEIQNLEKNKKRLVNVSSLRNR